MSESDNATPVASSPRDPAADTDPLLHLYKMSTTAGVGTQEYAAVNVTAVVSVLFGLASLLAIISKVLLVIPLVGVILGILSFRQIKKSNGTQTGLGLAVLGLVLCAVFSLGLLGYQGMQAMQRRADERAINDLCGRLTALTLNHQFDDAYALFDAPFKERVDKPLFDNQLEGMTRGAFPMSLIGWNGLAIYQTDDDGSERAEIGVRFEYKGTDWEDREGARLRKVNGSWLFDSIPRLFPSPPKKKP